MSQVISLTVYWASVVFFVLAGEKTYAHFYDPNEIRTFAKPSYIQETQQQKLLNFSEQKIMEPYKSWVGTYFTNPGQGFTQEVFSIDFVKRDGMLGLKVTKGLLSEIIFTTDMPIKYKEMVKTLNITHPFYLWNLERINQGELRFQNNRGDIANSLDVTFDGKNFVIGKTKEILEFKSDSILIVEEEIRVLSRKGEVVELIAMDLVYTKSLKDGKKSREPWTSKHKNGDHVKEHAFMLKISDRPLDFERLKANFVTDPEEVQRRIQKVQREMKNKVVPFPTQCKNIF